ncbi:uncharacterized protein LOC106867260 [Octopus bimaculoides]|uniref:uncharacterized protein LOC106867260 n=1 Tax=Octopus bimaculoides TaxID=37653 RepID=UPI0022E96F4E|nr:uncharacterized protein LOC106867260 [Octopus bimaculoides]
MTARGLHESCQGPYPGFDLQPKNARPMSNSRVRPEAEEYATMHKGSLNLFESSYFTGNNGNNNVKSRCPSQASRENLVYSRQGSVSKIIHCQATPRPDTPNQTRIRPEALSIAEVCKQKCMHVHVCVFSLSFAKVLLKRVHANPHNYIKYSLFFTHQNPLTGLWMTQGYTIRHLPKVPCSGTEPGTMWLVSKLLTTQPLLNILIEIMKIPSQCFYILITGASMAAILSQPPKSKPVPTVFHIKNTTNSLCLWEKAVNSITKGEQMRKVLSSNNDAEIAAAPAARVKREGQHISNLDRGGRMNKLIYDTSSLPAPIKPVPRCGMSKVAKKIMQQNRGTVGSLLTNLASHQIVLQPGVRS